MPTTRKTHAEQVADYSASCDAFEDEGYPQSFSQWRKLEADRQLAEDDLALVPVERIAPGRIAA